MTTIQLSNVSENDQRISFSIDFVTIEIIISVYCLYNKITHKFDFNENASRGFTLTSLISNLKFIQKGVEFEIKTTNYNITFSNIESCVVRLCTQSPIFTCIIRNLNVDNLIARMSNIFEQIATM